MRGETGRIGRESGKESEGKEGRKQERNTGKQLRKQFGIGLRWFTLFWMLSCSEIPRYLGYVPWIMSQMSRVVGDAPQRPAAPFELGTRGLADIQRLGVTCTVGGGMQNPVMC